MVEQETGVLFVRDAGEIFQDPDLIKSKLPQPYRMIDKVLNHILELAWSKIVVIEEKKERFRNRLKTPKCKFSDMMKPFSNVTKIAVPDYNNGFVVVGLTDGLAVVKYSDGCGKNLALWQGETSTELISVARYEKADDCFYIAASDNKGILRVFCFFSNKMFLVWQSVEQQNEVERSNLMEIVDLTLSPCCEFIAVALHQLHDVENIESSKKFSMELYVLPPDEWFSSIMTHVDENPEEPHLPDVQSLDDLKSRVVKDVAFSRPKLLMSQDQPISPPIPSELNFDEIFKRQDADSQVIGLGRQAVITQSITDSRWNLLIQAEKQKMDFVEHFEKANFFLKTFRDPGYGECVNESSQYDYNDEVGDKKRGVQVTEWLKSPEKVQSTKPCFHFITSSKSQSQGSITRQFVLYWKYRSNIYYYDLDNLKKSSSPCPGPDILWTTPSAIVTSSGSSSSSMVLVSDGNNIIIWNAKLGILKDVVQIADTGSIVDVIVVDKSHSQDECNQGRSFEIKKQTDIHFWVVVLSTSGYIYVLDTKQAACPAPIKEAINPFIESNAEVPLSIHKLQGIKDTFAIVQSDCKVFLYNIIGKKNVCEIVMSDCCFTRPHVASLTSSVDSNDQYFFMIGHHAESVVCFGDVESSDERSKSISSEDTKEEKKEETADKNDPKMALSGSWHSCIFIFKVSDFIASQKLLKRQNTPQYVNVSPSTLTKTLSANKDILDRIQKQDRLKERLAQKWLERRKAFNNTVVL